MIFTMYTTISDNLWQLFIFSNYIREVGHFKLDLLKKSDT